MSTVLPKLATPLTADQAAQALAIAYKRRTGKKPTDAILGMLIAQSGHETADWTSFSNFNMAGVKAIPSDPYIQYLRCFEVVNGETIYYDPPDPHCAFAAHKTAADGAERFIAVLQSRPSWWDGLQTGNLVSYVKAMSDKYPKYFTGDPQAYLKRMQERMTKYAAYAKKYSGGIFTTILGLLFGGGIAYGSYRYINRK